METITTAVDNEPSADFSQAFPLPLSRIHLIRFRAASQTRENQTPRGSRSLTRRRDYRRRLYTPGLLFQRELLGRVSQ